MNGNPFGLGSVWKIISGWHMAHYRMPSAKNQMLLKLRPTFCGPGIWTRTDFRALQREQKRIGYKEDRADYNQKLPE